MFKTNVKTFVSFRFVSLRKAPPPINLVDLQALTTHFSSPDYDFPLDPTYEPERSEKLRDGSIPVPNPLKNTSFLCSKGT
ncbi:hypothetical protein PSCICO_31590 [Pseudomonas cichorii]|uniref:hypothetical protein n=1 Tax=Pseudomonas cichorii TaxID=36746 RepID=UPI001F3F3737|nr:hypothetical protein [Pseudomonas cichorii]GFM87760.1 hypothetical protein PSCICO_31590 [Pseudomonas cichorii]